MINMENSNMNYSELLKARFDNDDIEWRVQQSGLDKNGKPWCMVIPFIQARAIQERLDDVFGFENWEDTYRQTTKNGWICTLKVTVNGKTVTKENGADETNIEPTKGGISDSFKRVASSGYGIGRYLYKEKFRFAECSINKQNGFTEKAKTKNGTYFYWKIPTLENVYQTTPEQVKRLCTIQTKANVSDEIIKNFIMNEFGINSRKKLNNLQYEAVIKKLEATMKTNKKEAS